MEKNTTIIYINLLVLLGFMSLTVLSITLFNYFLFSFF